MTADRILLTGASGAVGHCVVRELLTSTRAELVLLVRATSALPPGVTDNPRVRCCVGDLAEGAQLAGRLPHVERAVLMATSWGPEAEAVNLGGTLALVSALRERGARHVIWFGTASVVRADGSPDPAAVEMGTPYVRSKARCHLALRERSPGDVTIVHPTLVVSGDAAAPPSHVARLLADVERHAWLARWLRGEGSCHLVHADDLARLVRQLVVRDPGAAPRELIAGAPATSLEELLTLVLERSGRRRRSPAVDLTPRRIEWLVRAFAIQLSPWDRRCLAARHFTYRDARLTLDPQEPARHPTTRAIITTVPRRRP